MSITFFVAGIPQQKGSKRSYVRGDRAVIRDMNPRAKGFQQLVALVAQQHYTGEPLTCPVSVTLDFTLTPPAAMVPGRKLWRERRGWPATTPDLDKLCRVALDGLTGVCFADDKLVCGMLVRKRYGERPGMLVIVDELEAPR